MGSRGNRGGGGGDRVLESRHVIGLFLLMLVFSGVFFALGYVMGRNQYDGQVRAESTPRATPDPVYAAKSDLSARRPKNSAATANSTSSGSSSNSGWGSVSPTPSSASPRGGSTPAAVPTATSVGNNSDESAAPTSDWSYFSSAKNAPDDRLTPQAPVSPQSSAATSPASPSAGAAAGKNPKPAINPNSAPSKSAFGPSGPIPAGNYVLQVAAMRQTADANAVVKSLVAKHFPAFVVNPTTDKYYHVQVGPYHDVKSADAAKKGLESAGFKAIVKH
jgi:cell division septation protein DedD